MHAIYMLIYNKLKKRQKRQINPDNVALLYLHLNWDHHFITQRLLHNIDHFLKLSEEVGADVAFWQFFNNGG